jgi:branched-chain amino acid transport system substrate-binding protein
VRPAVVLALLVLAVAGCSGDDKPSATEQAPPTTTVKIVSELPLKGLAREQTESMVNAIELYLDQIDHKVGDIAIEYESHDTDSSPPKAGPEYACQASDYIDEAALVGVIGPFSSSCARVLVPTLNELPIAVVSPSNTDVGLTHQGPGSVEPEPDPYFPSGVRTYVRIVPPDDVQGQVGAKTMAGLGVTSVCVLDDREMYGQAVADAFELAAKDEGIHVACRHGWRHRGRDTNYLGLMEKGKASGANGVYIGGTSDRGGAQLIQDKLAVVGDHEAVKLLVSDGFVVNELFDEAGSASLEGLYGTTPALSPQDLTGAGAAFVAAYAAEYGEPRTYTAYGAAAAQVLVDAIGRSDGTRADIAAKLFETDIPDGIVGPVTFDPNGDRVDAPVAVFQARHGAWEFLEASP